MDKLAADWYIIGKMYLIKDTGCLVGDSNGTIGTNGQTWQSIGTPLVNCISLRGLGIF